MSEKSEKEAEFAKKSEKDVKRATDVDEQHVLGTTPDDYSSAAPDKKSPLEEITEEIKARKRFVEAKLKAIEAKKRSHKKELEETEAKKKSFAEEGKLLDKRVKILEGAKTDFEEKLKITEEWICECFQKKRCIADKEKELEEEIGRIKIELEKLNCHS